MSVLMTNDASTILASGITNSQTTLTVNAGTGALFPNPTGGDIFYVTVSSASNPAQFEIMICTARSTDTLTVVRGQDGTSGTAFSASDVVASLQNRGVMNDMRTLVSLPTSTGSANAQAVTNTVPLVAMRKGAYQEWIPGFTNTGDTTLASDSLAATHLKAFGQNLQAGMIVLNIPAAAIYDGTNWQLQNPQVKYSGLPTSTGSANAQVIANTVPLAGLTAGTFVTFTPGFNNTGAMTLAVDGQAAKNVFAYAAALLGNEIQSGVPVTAMYDGTQYNVLNPNDASGSFTLALTATSGASGTVFWRIIQGRLAVLTIYTDNLGTSTATTMTGTGAPVFLRPVTDTYVLGITIRNAAASAPGEVLIPSASSTWTFSPTTVIQASFPAAFTASGNKGVLAQTFSYALKN